MVRVDLDSVIECPIDNVFRRLIDISGYSRWMPRVGVFINSGETSRGPVGLGTTYFDMGWSGKFRGEIVEFQEPTRLAFNERLKWLGVTVIEARPAYELAPTEAGTLVHHSAEGELFGPFKFMEPVLAWVARGERKRTLNALKRSLEREQRTRPQRPSNRRAS